MVLTKKRRRFFKVFPVPIYTHTPEAGNIFGLALLLEENSK
jgi:hypothetical protein